MLCTSSRISNSHLFIYYFLSFSWLFKVNVLDKSDFDVRKTKTRVNKKKR